MDIGSLFEDTRFNRGVMNVVHMVIRPRTPVDPNEIKSQVLGGNVIGNNNNNGGNTEERDTSHGCSCGCVVL
jgi:hypothetical protein